MDDPRKEGKTVEVDLQAINVNFFATGHKHISGLKLLQVYVGIL
jgi:hypothetical protein